MAENKALRRLSNRWVTPGSRCLYVTEKLLLHLCARPRITDGLGLPGIFAGSDIKIFSDFCRNSTGLQSPKWAVSAISLVWSNVLELVRLFKLKFSIWRMTIGAMNVLESPDVSWLKDTPILKLRRKHLWNILYHGCLRTYLNANYFSAETPFPD